MIYYDHPQGSQEWLDARRGVITASRFKDCRDKLKSGAPSKACTLYAQDVARERVGGKAQDKMVNSAMRFGTEQEPMARMAYEVRTRNFVNEVGFYTSDDRMFGISVDGLVGDDGAVEIKTLVSSDTLFTVLSGDISAYTDQVNGIFWLMGRKWVDLVLWAPDLECIGRHLTIIRLYRDEKVIEALEDDLLAFSRMVEANVKILVPEIAPADWRNEFTTTD